jgi:hypothetical protein
VVHESIGDEGPVRISVAPYPLYGSAHRFVTAEIALLASGAATGRRRIDSPMKRDSLS